MAEYGFAREVEHQAQIRAVAPAYERAFPTGSLIRALDGPQIDVRILGDLNSLSSSSVARKLVEGGGFEPPYS